MVLERFTIGWGTKCAWGRAAPRRRPQTGADLAGPAGWGLACRHRPQAPLALPLDNHSRVGSRGLYKPDARVKYHQFKGCPSLALQACETRDARLMPPAQHVVELEYEDGNRHRREHYHGDEDSRRRDLTRGLRPRSFGIA
jgi:hypothetical protein